MAKFAVVLPWPSAALFPNKRRGSFRNVQPYVESARGSGLYYTRQEMRRLGYAITFSKREAVRITFMAPDRRRRDMDGMHGALKHYMDGVAQALSVDDSIFRPVILDDGLDPDKKGYVLVEIGESNG